MTDELRDLGRRAIACRGWRWMDGMLDGNAYGERYIEDRDGFLIRDSDGWGYTGLLDGSLPDFSDPATLGCLLRLVREAWDDEWLTSLGFYNSSGAQWFVHGGKPHGRHFLVRVTGEAYPSEAEALIAALEAAP